MQREVYCPNWLMAGSITHHLPVDQGGQPAVKFHYNDRNHRVKKESYANGSLASTTYYVRDVAGQVMAIYNDGGGSMTVVERPIYGSGRIGVAYNGGNTLYELTDHLGNVRAVFTKDQGNADLEGYTDYYPFGMPMPGRLLSGAEAYRYAYQGQEKDDETGKEAFELRLWDSRIGRWLTTDPKRIHHSPYLGMANNPIVFVDPSGGYPTPLEAARMAAFVYEPSVSLIGGWELSKITGFNRDDQTGLKSTLFSRELENGKTEYAYVFQGTNDWSLFQIVEMEMIT